MPRIKKNCKRKAAASRLLKITGWSSLLRRVQHAALLQEFMKDELKGDLSPASLETLAIIAYFGLVPRAASISCAGVQLELYAPQSPHPRPGWTVP